MLPETRFATGRNEESRLLIRFTSFVRVADWHVKKRVSIHSAVSHHLPQLSDIAFIMNKKRLFIADLRSHADKGKTVGHFAFVAKMYRKMFGDLYDVKVAGGSAYRNHFTGEELCELPHNVSNTTIRDRWHVMKNAIKLFKEAEGGIIVLQQSAVQTYFVALALFYRRKSRLYLIQYSDESLKSRLSRFLYRLIRHKVDGILCSSELVGKRFGRPYLITPDYIYLEDEKTPLTKYEDKKYDFCVLGRISPEKCVPEVVDRFKNEQCNILIAGNPQTKELGDEIRGLCEGRSNITLDLGFLDAGTYENYLKDSRYCILNYGGPYVDSARSSGVVFDMLFHDVPVIGTRCGALEFVERHQMGRLYTDLSAFRIEDVLDESTYEGFRKNIAKYKDLHKTYLQQLRAFVT